MLVAYTVALDLVRQVRPIVPILKRFDREIGDQLQRAATGVVLNIGEGRRRQGGDQRRVFDIAHGEASEVAAAIDCAEAWGLLGESPEVRKTLDRLLGLLWGLTHPRAR